MDHSESIVQINEHHLDRECIQLPSDYLKAANLAADRKRDVDEIKNRLEVVEADLSKEIRSKPEAYGIDKLTETAISQTILTQPRYQKVLARLQRAKHEADLAQALVWALEHKKRTLTLLVELHGMGYFSSPKVSEAGKEAVKAMTMRKLRHRDDA